MILSKKQYIDPSELINSLVDSNGILLLLSQKSLKILREKFFTW